LKCDYPGPKSDFDDLAIAPWRFDRIISISVRVFALVVPQHDERELISLGISGFSC